MAISYRQALLGAVASVALISTNAQAYQVLGGNGATVTGTGAVAGGDEANAGAAGAIALGYRANASRTGNIAVGRNSAATGNQAVAIGNNAKAVGDSTVFVGNDSGVGATGNRSVGIGYGAGHSAQGMANTAIGYTSGQNVVGQHNTAVGGTNTGTLVTGDFNNAFGSNALYNTTGSRNAAFGAYAGQNSVTSNAISIGDNAGRFVEGIGTIAMGALAGNGQLGNRLVVDYATSIGTGAQAQANHSLALGSGKLLANGNLESLGARATGEAAIAIGGSATQAAFASGTAAIGIGEASVASGASSVALGRGAQALGANSISIGTENVVNGDGSGAIGDPTIIDAANSYSVGNNNRIGAGSDDAFLYGNNIIIDPGVARVTALGTDSKVNVSGGVALGAGSIADAPVATTGTTIGGTAYTFAGIAPSSTVSIGLTGNERALTNVAAGRLSATSTDAVNGSQLFATNQAVEALSLTAGKTPYVSINRSGAAAGNVNSDGATANNAIAIGPDASATQVDTIAIGYGAEVTGQQGIAIGTDAMATSDSTVFIGSGAGKDATGYRSTGVGFGAGRSTVGEHNAAFGYNAGQNVTGSQNTSLGGGNTGSGSTGDGNTSVGYISGYQINGNYNSSLGLAAGQNSTGNSTVSVGHNSGTWRTGDGTINIGAYAGSGTLSTPVDMDQTVSIGTGARALADHSVALGSGTLNATSGLTAYGARALGEASIAIGGSATQSALSEGAGSIALGEASYAQSDASMALGQGTNATADRALALGANANAAHADSVALGADSVTDAAVGTASTTLQGTSYSFAGTAPVGTVSIGSAGNERTLTNVAAGRLSATSTDAVNGSQLFATNEALNSLSTTAAAGWNISADGTNATAVGSGSTTGNAVDLSNSDGNLVVAKTGASNDVTFDLADDVTVANSLTVGSTVLNASGLTTNALTVGPNFTVDGSGATYSGPITDANHIANKQYVDDSVAAAASNVGIDFAGNDGSTVRRNNGQTLTIRGDASTAGTYSAGNIQTVTDDTTGELLVQFAEAPRFGNVVINDGGSGRITGVAPGVLSATSDHAVNGSQLVALGDSMAAAFSPTSNYDPATNSFTARIAIGDTVYNNVQDAIVAAMNSGSGGGTGGEGDGGTATVPSFVVPGGTSPFIPGENIVSTQGDDGVTVSLDRNLTNLESIQVAGGPTINADGINMAGDRITNLADGVAPTDAVNVRQLNAGLADTLASANTYTDNAVNYLGAQMSDLRRDANGGTAAAMAMSSLPQAYVPGSNMVGMGISTWGTEQALAVGYSRSTSDGRFVLKASGTYNTRSQGGASVGVGFQF